MQTCKISFFSWLIYLDTAKVLSFLAKILIFCSSSKTTQDIPQKNLLKFNPWPEIEIASKSRMYEALDQIYNDSGFPQLYHNSIISSLIPWLCNDIMPSCSTSDWQTSFFQARPTQNLPQIQLKKKLFWQLLPLTKNVLPQSIIQVGNGT